MSITSATQRTPSSKDIPVCSQCGDYRNPNNCYRGSFCDEYCWYKHKGQKAQNLIKYDHRICGTCANQIKTVNPPTKDWEQKHQSMQQVLLENGAELTQGPESIEIDATDVSGKRPTTNAVIGFQTSTEHATDVTREYGESEYSVQNIIKTGLGCECGNADTSFVSETLQNVDIKSVLVNYITTFWALEREGQLDQRLDKDVFIQSYKESEDLVYALGRSLHT